MTYTQEKGLLREKLRKERAAFLSKHGHAAANAFTSSAILSIQQNLSFQSADVIAGYWPLREEADCRSILYYFANRQTICCLPCVEKETLELTFRAWTPQDRLCISSLFPQSMRLMEPEHDRPRVQPSVLFVPLLGFTRQGYRLGYGSGYYDMTLIALKKNHPITTIGLGFSCQETEHMPIDPHDQPLDWIMTEREMFRCVAR